MLERKMLENTGKEVKCSCNSQVSLYLRDRVQEGCKKQKCGTVFLLLGSSDIGTSCARDFGKAVLFNGHKITHPL